MKAIIIFVAVLALAYADQYVPIPSKPYGFSLGDPDGTFHVQAFLDLQCTSLKKIRSRFKIGFQYNDVSHENNRFQS